jgi:hypothetical protein
MFLSYDWTGLKSLVDNMTPNGNTNQAIGLAWPSMAAKRPASFAL